MDSTYKIFYLQKWDHFTGIWWERNRHIQRTSTIQINQLWVQVRRFFKSHTNIVF